MIKNTKTFTLSKKEVRRAGGRFQGIQWHCQSGRLRTANVQILSKDKGDRKNPSLLVMRDSKGNYLTVTLSQVTYFRQDGRVKGKIYK